MQKLNYVGTGKQPLTGTAQVKVISDAEIDDIPGLIAKLKTMDKVKPGDIANGATPVKDLWTGKIVGYIK